MTFYYKFDEPTITGELNHRGVSYSLFTDQPLSVNSPLIVGPINDFWGEPQGGNWQFKLETEGNYVFVNSWSIQTIPEPSTFALLGLGLAALLVNRKRKI